MPDRLIIALGLASTAGDAGPDLRRAVVIFTAAALLMLLVFVGVVLVILSHRHLRGLDSKRTGKADPLVDAWAEAGRRMKEEEEEEEE